MTRISKNLLLSALVLATGLVLIGSLMIAFVGQAQAREMKARPNGSTLEVSINNNGRVLVRGAEVTAISGDTLSARTEWGASALSWTVETTSDTDVVAQKGAVLSMESIEVGDIVSFSGILDATGSTFTVDADVVKNWSSEGAREKEDRTEARVEAKTELRAKWGEWMRGIPLMHWFDKHDNR